MKIRRVETASKKQEAKLQQVTTPWLGWAKDVNEKQKEVESDEEDGGLSNDDIWENSLIWALTPETLITFLLTDVSSSKAFMLWKRINELIGNKCICSGFPKRDLEERGNEIAIFNEERK